MRNKLFAAVFCGIILLVMLSAPLKHILTSFDIINFKNVGNIIEADKVYEEGSFGAPLFNGIEEIKRTINDTYTNYIPFYVDITAMASKFQQNLNRPVTSFLMNEGNRIMSGQVIQTAELNKAADNTEASSESAPQQEETAQEVKKAFTPEYKAVYLDGNGSHRYYEIKAVEEENGQEMKFLVRIPARENDSLRNEMDEQLRMLNGFAKACPDVNLYVFPVTCFEDTLLCTKILPSESKNELFTEFFTRLDTSIQYDYVRVDSAADKYNKYFRTDHHWNAYGYTEAYDRIFDMLAENYPELNEQKRPYQIHSFNKVSFYGSNACAIANYSYMDEYAVADFSLPAHKFEIETNVPYGSSSTLEENLAKYYNGTYNKAETFNHYIEFYRIARKIEYPQNSTGRNLLLIGDSYSPPLTEALASYFDITYVRYVDSNSGLSDIDYKNYIERYGITDVIMLEMSDRVIYNYYGDSLKGINVD